MAALNGPTNPTITFNSSILSIPLHFAFYSSIYLISLIVQLPSTYLGFLAIYLKFHVETDMINRNKNTLYGADVASQGLISEDDHLMTSQPLTTGNTLNDQPAMEALSLLYCYFCWFVTHPTVFEDTSNAH